MVLHSPPFSLPWASHIYAKVTAANIYGNSLSSEVGNGAVIYAVPDAPVSLAENRNERTSTTLGLTWSDGPDSGGLTVTKYRVTVSSLTGTFLVIADDISL